MNELDGDHNGATVSVIRLDEIQQTTIRTYTEIFAADIRLIVTA